MNMMLTFNIGFDIAVIALILFAGWFYANIRNAQKAFKWLASSILAIILSTLIIGYGGTKITQSSNQANQNQYEIRTLNQRIKDLKGEKATHSTKSANNKDSTEEIRVVNQVDANQVMNQVSDHHATKVNLVAKVYKAGSSQILARGVHSGQLFEINPSESSHDSTNKGEFIVANGKATSIKKVNGKPVINVKAKTVRQQ